MANWAEWKGRLFGGSRSGKSTAAPEPSIAFPDLIRPAVDELVRKYGLSYNLNAYSPMIISVHVFNIHGNRKTATIDKAEYNIKGIGEFMLQLTGFCMELGHKTVVLDSVSKLEEHMTQQVEIKPEIETAISEAVKIMKGE